jgi:plasmid stabilization system protein ParE
MEKRKIIWSQRATIKLFEILDFYTNRNKSKSYSAKLYKRFTKELNLLRKQPELGRTTDDESVRGLIIEEFILFYEITEDRIIVHTVWDCRQNPEDLRIK